MKFSRGFLIINVVILIFSLILLIPSFDLNMFGRSFKFGGLDLSEICFESSKDEETGDTVKSKCLPEFHFSNNGNFNNRNVLVYEFTDINNSQEDNSIKDTKFNENVNILQNRINTVGMEDVRVRGVKSEEGKYFVEIYYFQDDRLKKNALDLLVTPGSISVYEDIENYKPAEDQEAGFNFLEGKQISEVLNIQDVKRIRHYYDPSILRGQGGFVVRLDFGDENLEKVMAAAKPTYNTDTPFPGIQLVQNGVPIGVQAEYISPAQSGYNGQSHVLFTIWGSPQSSSMTKSLASILTTKSINTNIVLAEDKEINSSFDPQAIEFVKLLIPFGMVLISIGALVNYKKKGLFLSSVIISQTLVIFALIKIFAVQLNSAIIVGYISSLLLTIFLWTKYLATKSGYALICDEVTNVKKAMWVMFVILLLVGVVWEYSRVDDIFLSGYHGLLLFSLSVIYGIEIGFRSFSSILDKASK